MLAPERQHRERPQAHHVPDQTWRVHKLGFRRGDGAETAMVELVGSEFDPKKAAEEKAAAEAAGTDSPAPKKSVGQRLRAAAKNIRGAEKKDKKTAAHKASKPARGAQKKSTTPRKAGGS